MKYVPSSDDPKTRKEAVARGISFYFPGLPCKNGHVDKVLVRGTCAQCARDKTKAWQLADPERARNSSHSSYLKNKKTHAAATAKYRENNKERLREWNKQWRAANRERLLEGKKVYYQAHKQRWLELSKQRDPLLKKKQNEKYREANREKLRAAAKSYFSTNRDRCLGNVANYRARKLEAEGFHTAADVARIRSAQKDKCAYCKVGLHRRGHLDHIQPLASGGTNWPANLQLLCAPCNRSKGAKDPIAYRQQLGGLL